MKRRFHPFSCVLLLGLLVGLGFGVPWHLASHGPDDACPFEMLLGSGGPLPDSPALTLLLVELPVPPSAVSAPRAPVLERARSRAPPTAWI